MANEVDVHFLKYLDADRRDLAAVPELADQLRRFGVLCARIHLVRVDQEFVSRKISTTLIYDLAAQGLSAKVKPRFQTLHLHAGFRVVCELEL